MVKPSCFSFSLQRANTSRALAAESGVSIPNGRRSSIAVQW